MLSSKLMQRKHYGFSLETPFIFRQNDNKIVAIKNRLCRYGNCLPLRLLYFGALSIFKEYVCSLVCVHNVYGG